jgi:hypothetical protein
MGIRYILTGWNLSTEAILPAAWGYNSADLRHLRAIQRRFGTSRLKHYPTLGFARRFFWYRYAKRIALIRPLDYLGYRKSDAMEVLQNELGWKYYGGKHYESQFTRFFQSYYLPTRFGFDKRRCHHSSLICSGQLTREEALADIQQPPCPLEEALELRRYIAKKLGITDDEFVAIMSQPVHQYSEYPNNEWLFNLAARFSVLVLRRPVV